MANNIKLILLLEFFLVSSICHSQIIATKKFNNYLLSIPSGWKESTRSELEEFRQETKQLYDLLIYPQSKSNFNGPPFIVTMFKKKEIRKEEYEGIAKGLLKTFKTQMNDFVPTEFANEIKMIKPGEGYYDKKASCFTYMYETELKGVGKSYSIFTGFFTPHGVITLQFTDNSKNYLKSVDGFIQLVKSLKKIGL